MESLDHKIAKLIIEPLPSQDELGMLLVTDEERRTADGFGAARRRAEYLGWRSIVRRELGRDVAIGYTDEGAPVLRNRSECISVSHSADYLAVLISTRRCAVDIERLSRNFSNISSRYISSGERLLSSDPRLEAAVWCAKETIYKYAGRTGLDFLRDIHVEKVDFEAGIVVGRVSEGDSVEMQMSVYDGNLIVRLG